MIPVSKPWINDQDVYYVSDAVNSGWVSSIGEYIDKFENALCSYTNFKNCVTVSNGTVGLHLALVGMGINKDHEVIVPDITFAATINAVIYTGAKPVIVHVEKNTIEPSYDSIISRVNSRTRAIITVDLYGRPYSEIAKLAKFCKKNSIFLISDSAESLGATIDGCHTGTLCDLTIFSFYGNKTITTGEGGAILTDDDYLFDKLRLLRDHGMSKDKRYWHNEVGFNYRMTNMQAALGYSQIQRIKLIIEDRRRIYNEYKSRLDGLRFRILNVNNNVSSSNWLIDVWVEGVTNELQRNKIIHNLKHLNIDSRPTFYPLSFMPPYKEFFTRPDGFDYQKYYSFVYSGICLPTFYDIKSSDIDKISNILNNMEL